MPVTVRESVLVAPARWQRWLANFESSHGAMISAARTHVGWRAQATDGSSFEVRLPFDLALPPSLDLADPADLAGAAVPPVSWGVLLVRKGGYAVARLDRGSVVARSVGQRHVQGRTKAGGQSQQRFARRRANQAQRAYQAAAQHAAEVLGATRSVVTGGDRAAVSEVLSDPRLAHVAVVGPWLAVPDPRGRILDAAILDAQKLLVVVENAVPRG